MDHRTRSLVAVAGTVGLFLCIQLGALVLLDPYVAADAQPVDDPSNATNIGYFFGVILVATAAMLAAIKFDLENLIRGFVLLSCGWIGWLVLDTLVRSLGRGESSADAVGTATETVTILLPIVIAGGLVLALFVHPEWYVIDAAGVLLGAGAAGLFGLAFTPQLTILFLVLLAVYDAVSVYGTEHMLTLAEGVADLNVPVLLVVPTTRSFSLLTADGPNSLARGESPDGDDPDASPGNPAPEVDGGTGSPSAESAGDDGSTIATDADSGVAEHSNSGTGGGSKPGTGESTSSTSNADESGSSEGPARDAIYIGLGDAVMPTILVVSAAYFLRDAAPLYDVPLVAVNLPAVTALLGTLLGLLVLLGMVLKGRPQAGLPLLNGGAIGGYLVGALLSGIGLVEALGLPL